MSDLEDRFEQEWDSFSKVTCKPVREYIFCHGRKFRFDFAWIEFKVAVEMDGGTWTHRGHTSGKGFRKDAEKFNLAVLNGWSVFHFTTDMFDDNQFECISQVCELLRARGAKKKSPKFRYPTWHKDS